LLLLVKKSGLISRAAAWLAGEGRRRVALLLLISCELRDAAVVSNPQTFLQCGFASFNPQTLLCLKANQQLGGTQQL